MYTHYRVNLDNWVVLIANNVFRRMQGLHCVALHQQRMGGQSYHRSCRPRTTFRHAVIKERL